METVRDRVGGFERDVHETDGLQAGAVLGERQRPGDAADEAASRRPLGGVERVVGHDVADADPATRSQDARDLGEDRGLVGREVDDAVADDDVDRRIRQRDRLDPALSGTRRSWRRPRRRSSRRARASRRSCRGRRRSQSDRRVGRRAGRRCRHRTRGRGRSSPGRELGDRRRVAATETREDGGVGQRCALPRRRRGGHRRRPRRRAAAVRGGLWEPARAREDGAGGLGVSSADLVGDDQPGSSVAGVVIDQAEAVELFDWDRRRRRAIGSARPASDDRPARPRASRGWRARWLSGALVVFIVARAPGDHPGGEGVVHGVDLGCGVSMCVDITRISMLVNIDECRYAAEHARSRKAPRSTLTSAC